MCKWFYIEDRLVLTLCGKVVECMTSMWTFQRLSNDLYMVIGQWHHVSSWVCRSNLLDPCDKAFEIDSNVCVDDVVISYLFLSALARDLSAVV